MITTKQRAALRSLANREEALYQIGKNGITENLLQTLSDALEARELIKITVQAYAEGGDGRADGPARLRAGAGHRPPVGRLPREQNE